MILVSSVRSSSLKNYVVSPLAKHCLIAFLTPANAMLSVELSHLADILDAAGKSKNVSTSARSLSSRIHNAIMNFTVCLLRSNTSICYSIDLARCQIQNNIFAYETNGS